jgi:hypothetical protein
MIVEHYNPNKDWDQDKHWHKVIIQFSPGKFPKMINWLYANIDKPERHARWKIVDDTMQFKFRYERDYIMFTLRWS